MHPLSRFRKECKARRLRWLDLVTWDNDAPRTALVDKKRTDSGRLLAASESGRYTPAS